jgi:hypothetical protein
MGGVPVVLPVCHGAGARASKQHAFFSLPPLCCRLRVASGFPLDLVQLELRHANVC